MGITLNILCEGTGSRFSLFRLVVSLVKKLTLSHFTQLYETILKFKFE